MHSLGWTFAILSVCGALRPSSWTSRPTKILYNFYTIFLFFLTHFVLLFQILDMVFNVENQDDFSDSIYVTLAIFVACYKLCNYLLNRRNIAVLVDTLERDPFLPINIWETEIQTKYVKNIRWNAIAYTILIEFSVAWTWITSFFRDFKHKQLTYRAWIPYDYSSMVSFTITYTHQIVGITFCTLFNVAYDTLHSGLLIHTYCQLEILGHRLQNIIKDDNDSAKHCAYHHHCIYEFATMLNQTFKTVACIQFLVSTSVVCFNLYQLTQKDLGSRLVETMFYAICMLTEIFYYCWYGNEVTIKSLEISNMIIESDWVCLDINAKKILLMMMIRATEPIKFTSIHVVSMNLECFMSLLKTSFSAYNVLQQSRE